MATHTSEAERIEEQFFYVPVHMNWKFNAF